MGSYLIRRFLLMAADAVRHVGADLRDAAARAGQHRRHPGRSRPASPTPRRRPKIARELGLDRPILEQYVQWIGGLARGDLGFAYVSERPAIEEIAPRIPISAKLAGTGAVLLGACSACRSASSARCARTPASTICCASISLSGLSLPSFWLGLLVLMAFGAVVRHGSRSTPTSRAVFLAEIVLLSIPAAAVGFRSSALIMRLTRSSMLEVLRQDYIRTARSKGASQTTVNYEHALRNALLPVVTIIGIEAAFLVGGLIVTETVFNIPGVARFLVEAILLARLSDRAEPRDADRLRRGDGQFPGRHGLHGPRPAHQVRGLRAAMARHRPRRRARQRAGANVTGAAGGQMRFLARRYPLGAVGAVIVLLFMLHGAVRQLHRAVRSDGDQRQGLAGRARRRPICWAPTSWAATCSAASSTARASRSPSASAPPCWAASWASRSA